MEIVCELDPGLFRALDKQVRPLQGQVEVLNMTVNQDADTLLKKPATSTTSSAISSTNPPPTTLPRPVVGLAQPRGKAHPPSNGKVSKLTCNGCGASFQTTQEHREHFRTDWHRMNQKRKAAGLPPLSEEECLAEALHESTLNDMDQFS